MLSLALAWRNLWRHRRRTWLTVGSMIFSNLLLIFAISLQLSTYEQMIKNSLRAFSAPLQLQKTGYNVDQKMRLALNNGKLLVASLSEAFPKLAIAPRAQAFVLGASETRSLGIAVAGVDKTAETRLSSIPTSMLRGAYLTGRAGEVVIGEALARSLQIDIGDELTLLGSGYDGSFAAAVQTVSGIFRTGVIELDKSVVQINWSDFDAIFFMGARVHSIALAPDSLNELARYQQSLQAFIDTSDIKTQSHNTELELLNWQALHPEIKQSIEADFASAWFMYAVLIALVAFSVLNTQLMSVLERTREFGIMMAIGCSNGVLVRLIVIENFLLAGLGFVLGLVAGGALVFYFSHAGLVLSGMEEAAALYNVPSTLYPQLSPLALLLGPSVLLLFCLLASLYPALRLIRLQPIMAMRAK
ncbi:ABC transporter permease [Agaribacterium haliotis]|uniref:ABC transporter permease n=1 Tax=Agaribacterium haliotis TaxID=2013869 RepID=UPI000BB54F44|nr:FtsX-like permease family protein [Agaribacterium haliotis]